MFDDEQLGFLAGDEYQRAAELRLPTAADRPAAQQPRPDARCVLTAVLGPALHGGRTDSRPGEVGK